jgi:LPXTG-motif cell wall-anchored protein
VKSTPTGTLPITGMDLIRTLPIAVILLLTGAALIATNKRTRRHEIE